MLQHRYYWWYAYHVASFPGSLLFFCCGTGGAWERGYYAVVIVSVLYTYL